MIVLGVAVIRILAGIIPLVPVVVVCNIAPLFKARRVLVVSLTVAPFVVNIVELIVVGVFHCDIDALDHRLGAMIVSRLCAY